MSSTHGNVVCAGGAAEEWRPVVGYEGSYSVSSLGRVRSEDRLAAGHRGCVRRIRGRVLARRINSSGYVHVALLRDGRASHVANHLLVARAFIGPIPDGMEVNHLDGDKTNASAENLEIVTPSENVRHAYRTGLKSGAAIRCERNGRALLSSVEVLWLREGYASGRATLRSLATTLGVGITTVGHVVHRHTWREMLPALQPEWRNCAPCGHIAVAAPLVPLTF